MKLRLGKGERFKYSLGEHLFFEMDADGNLEPRLEHWGKARQGGPMLTVVKVDYGSGVVTVSAR